VSQFSTTGPSTSEANQWTSFRYTVCSLQRWAIGLEIVATAQADLEKRLAAGLPLVGAAPTGEQVAALARFLRLLDKWNKAFNLTGVRDPLEMVTRHILDSVSARPYLHGISILDVGTGAGLPGMPLALMDPRRQFSLLDSGGKKIRFVRHAVGEMAVGNVSVVHERVENYAPADPFDTVLCRAFTSIGDFARRCEHLAAKGGRLLAMKGRFPDEELASLPNGWEVAEVAAVNIPDLVGDRHIVVLRRRAT
jgi:16S rRNA (guanine527-N7)-methyltransferase